MTTQLPATDLMIGWATRDISTTAPVYIPGQFDIRVSRGVQDPLSTTALVIANEQDAIIFVSVDSVYITPELIKLVHEAVAARDATVPTANIAIHATHTHEAPNHATGAIAGLATPETVPHEGVEIESSAIYCDLLVAAVSDAIVTAWSQRAPGGVSHGYGFAVVGHSRRAVYFDDLSQRPDVAALPGMSVNGHAKMYGSTADAKFSHYEAGTDPFINFLYTFDTAGQLTGAIINVPAPSQCSEHLHYLSADYWHEVRQTLHKRYGAIGILPQCAAAGDLSPRILHFQRAQQRRFALKYGNDGEYNSVVNAQRADIAERICHAFDEVLDWARHGISSALPIQHEVATIGLSRRYISDSEARNEEQLLAELMAEPLKNDGTPAEQLRYNSILIARRNRCARILDFHREQQTQPTCDVELHVARLGNIAFATNPFELYIDYMHRIQGRSPFELTFIVQLVGNPHGVAGYLATERGEAGRGYSASIYCNQVSFKGGQELVENTLLRLNRFAAEIPLTE